METGEFRKDVDGAIARGDAPGAARMLASAWELDPGSALAGFVASRYDRIAARLDLLRQRWRRLAAIDNGRCLDRVYFDLTRQDPGAHPSQLP